MTIDGYQYTLVLYRKDGTPVGEASVEVDWETAEEWARFSALRHSRLAAADVRRADAIEPVWHSTLGQPYVEGVRLQIATSGGDVAHQLSTAYFRGLARQASSQFV